LNDTGCLLSMHCGAGTMARGGANLKLADMRPRPYHRPMSDLTIILGNKNYSSWSLRAWLALKATGTEFDEIVIPLWLDGAKEQIFTHSPSGKVPALRHGDAVVWESLAICEHLAEMFPDAGLWPADPVARATARSVSNEMHAGFMALRRAMPMNCRAAKPGKGMTEGVAADVERVTAIWRDCRARFGTDGGLLFGGFTIADAMFAPVASRFRTYAVALDPVSAAYVDALHDLPAMRSWLAAAEAEPYTVAHFEI